MSIKKVLVISNPEDQHTKHVVSKISQLGAQPIMLFPEELGQLYNLSIDFAVEKQLPLLSLSTTSLAVDLNDVYSVWFRRPRLVALDSYAMSDEGLKFAREEWRAALEATYILMRQPLWVSHPDRLREAARKPLQLVLAQQLGFTVPSTLITNEPSLAKDFIQQCNEKVIVKPTGAGWVYSQDNVAVTYVLTNRVQQQDIDDLNKIKTAPITLQEEIVKAYEIRVNVVGQEVLPIKIDSQRSERSQVDWRRYDVSKTPYTPYQLPIDIQLACLKLTKLLGLEFGAIDLIRQPDGEYIFLEINGNGQFLWAEELSGVNVGDALALLLTGIAPPLRLANLE